MPIKHLEVCWTHSRWSERHEAIITVNTAIINSPQTQGSWGKALPMQMCVTPALAPSSGRFADGSSSVYGSCNVCQVQSRAPPVDWLLQSLHVYPGKLGLFAANPYSTDEETDVQGG